MQQIWFEFISVHGNPANIPAGQEFSLSIKWSKKDLVASQHFVNKCNWWFDFALPDMSDPLVQVEIREVRTLAKDPVIYTQWLDISRQIYTQDGGVSNYNFNHSIGLDNEWIFYIKFQGNPILSSLIVSKKYSTVRSNVGTYLAGRCPKPTALSVCTRVALGSTSRKPRPIIDWRNKQRVLDCRIKTISKVLEWRVL